MAGREGKYACILSLVMDSKASSEYFKQQLSIHEELVHISVEINQVGENDQCKAVKALSIGLSSAISNSQH